MHSASFCVRISSDTPAVKCEASWVCTYIHTYIHIHTYIYTYIHTQTPVVNKLWIIKFSIQYPGVNVIINIFDDFYQFLATKLVFSKNIVMIPFWYNICRTILKQKRHFFSNFLANIFLKIITSTSGFRNYNFLR
jgi:hypothetical protein